MTRKWRVRLLGMLGMFVLAAVLTGLGVRGPFAALVALLTIGTWVAKSEQRVHREQRIRIENGEVCARCHGEIAESESASEYHGEPVCDACAVYLHDVEAKYNER